MSALDTQVGGSHYKDLKIQPVEYITANNIPYMEGNIIKYVTRWREKGGLRDLEKARHYLDMLIEMQNKKAKDGLLKLVEKELEDCKGEATEKQDAKGFRVPYNLLMRETCGQGLLNTGLAAHWVKEYGEFTITKIPKYVTLDRMAKIAKALKLGMESSPYYTADKDHNDVYDVRYWSIADKPKKPTVSAASVHYENIKSYIANDRIAPALVDDYIKSVGRFVVRSVPVEVSTGVWAAFAVAQALDVQFIKQPMGLDGITRAYDVELWLKK